MSSFPLSIHLCTSPSARWHSSLHQSMSLSFSCLSDSFLIPSFSSPYFSIYSVAGRTSLLLPFTILAVTFLTITKNLFPFTSLQLFRVLVRIFGYFYPNVNHTHLYDHLFSCLTEISYVKGWFVWVCVITSKSSFYNNERQSYSFHSRTALLSYKIL